MNKIIIIGASIAGASAACVLAKHCDVVVYEQKAKKEIGKKLCANVVTPDFLECVKNIGLNPKKYILYKFEGAYAYSENNKAEFKTNEFRINREKLVEDLIKIAQKRGAKFVFDTEFCYFEKKDEKYIINFNNKKDFCDILIGADGPLSKVAKQAGLWKNRKLFLIIQTEVPIKRINNLKLDKKSYHIFFGRKHGYYGYVFPSKRTAVIGSGDRAERVKERYSDFLKFLGTKGGKVMAALAPEPKIIPQKKDLFVIGDAGCHIKFSGGGIVPAMTAAEAVKEIIVNKNFDKLKKLNKRTFVNKLATRLIDKSDDKDFDRLIQILNEDKFKGIIEKRDSFSRKEYLKILDFRILRILLKALF